MRKFSAASIALLALLAACSPIDRFADRVMTYNTEVERSRTQSMMLNILRSAYRKPLQFTDIISVTGQAVASASINSVVPLAGLASTYQLNPSAGWSGGPTFNVVALNTKEFYAGALAPIKLETIGSYVQQGRPIDMLFSLVVNKIVLQIDGTYTIFRSFGNEADWERFQDLVAELYDAGLTTQPMYLEQGPMTPRDTVGGLAENGLIRVPIDGRDGKFTTRMANPVVAFCFQDRRPSARPPSAVKPLVESLRKTMQCEDQPLQVTPETNRKYGNSLIIDPRSTLGVIYRLGDIARRELGLAGDNACAQNPSLPECGSAILHRWVMEGGKPVRKDRTFFRIQRGGSDRSLTVSYEGETFGIVADPSGFDHSAEVIELVQELLALNSSAKDLPSPNLIRAY